MSCTCLSVCQFTYLLVPWLLTYDVKFRLCGNYLLQISFANQQVSADIHLNTPCIVEAFQKLLQKIFKTFLLAGRELKFFRCPVFHSHKNYTGLQVNWFSIESSIGISLWLDRWVHDLWVQCSIKLMYVIGTAATRAGTLWKNGAWAQRKKQTVCRRCTSW